MATLWQQQDGGYMLFYIFNSTVVEWTCFFLPENHAVKKYSTASQATDDSMTHALCMLYT